MIISVTALLCTNMCQTTNPSYIKKLSGHMEPETVASKIHYAMRKMMTETGTSVVSVCSSENGLMEHRSKLVTFPTHVI